MNLHQELTGQIIQRYRSAGYEVHEGTPEDALNLGGRKYIPDLVASRGDTHVAIEFHEGQSDDAHDVQLKAQAVRDAGWKFELVMSPTESLNPPLSLEEIEQALATVTRLSSEYDDPRTSLLLGWSAIEAILRRACLQVGVPVDGRSPQDVLKQSVSVGFLEEEEFKFLINTLRSRNAAAHGVAMPANAKRLVHPLIRLAKDLGVRLKVGYGSEA